MKEKKVVLVGFSGAGKTSVGRELAEQYGWRWVDVDLMVESDAGRSIGEIIRVEGEPRFRELERKAVAKALAGSADVISLGGGALADSANAAVLRAEACLVHLAARTSTIVSRVLAEEIAARSKGVGALRPLLAAIADSDADRTGKNVGEGARESAPGTAAREGVDEAAIRQNVERLMEVRKHLYDIAHHTIATDELTVGEIAERIVEIRKQF